MTDTTRRCVAGGLIAATLVSDAKQPAGSVASLTTQDITALLEDKKGEFVTSVRRTGTRGERVVPLFARLEANAPQMADEVILQEISHNE